MIVLLVALFISTLGIGIILPILPFYAAEMDASGFWIGLIFSGFFIAQFISTPIAGRISDRLGQKSFIASGLVIYAVSSVGFIAADNLLSLTILRLGQGIAAGMIIPIAQAYTGYISPDRREGRYMGIFSFVLFTGFGLGPAMGGILKDLFCTNAGIYALSMLTLSAFFIVLIWLPNRKVHQKNRSSFKKAYHELIKNRVISGMIVLRFTIAISRGAIFVLIPFFVQDRLHLSSSEIGMVISGNIMATAILQIPCGLLADRANRRMLVIIGALFLSGLMFILPTVQSFSQIIVFSILFGACGALVLPAATALMVEEGRLYGMGAVMGLFRTSMNLGLVCGPLIAGWMADAMYFDNIFHLFGVLAIFGTFYFALNSKSSIKDENLGLT
jgi:MFS family permease